MILWATLYYFCTDIVSCDKKFFCFCSADWNQLIVDGAERTSVIIHNLEVDVEYCVKMKSVSFIGDSNFTSPLKHRVFRTGTNACVCLVIRCCFMPLSP